MKTHQSMMNAARAAQADPRTPAAIALDVATARLLEDLAEEGQRNRESDAGDGVEGAQAAYDEGAKALDGLRTALAKAGA